MLCILAQYFFSPERAGNVTRNEMGSEAEAITFAREAGLTRLDGMTV
jgi:hypothetical protein